MGKILGRNPRVWIYGTLAVLGLSGAVSSYRFSTEKADLSCRDAWRLVQWGVTHHGYFSEDFESGAFAEKAANSFASLHAWKKTERLAWKNQFKKNWLRLVKTQTCDVFVSAIPKEKQPHKIMVKALLATLDPHSTFYDAEEFADINQELSAEIFGIGVQIQESKKGQVISEIRPGSPAAEAKLAKGDSILAVDGYPLTSEAENEARKILRSDQFSELTLRVRRESKEWEVKLTKRALELNDGTVSVKSKSAGGHPVAVITVPMFYAQGEEKGKAAKSASSDLANALERLDPQTKALVLDFRGNPGGYLEEAVSMAGLFLGDAPSVAVVEQSRTRVLNDFRPQALYTGPVISLVDEHTASAAELFVAALRDYHRTVVVGAKSTYGKGSVQRLFHLDDPFLQLGTDWEEGVLRLTTSLFYSPLGRSAANGGIASDIALTDRQSRMTKGTVPEIPPVLDAAVMEKLNQEATRHQELIETLRVKQSERGETPSEDEVLAQAVELAHDLGRLQNSNAAF